MVLFELVCHALEVSCLFVLHLNTCMSTWIKARFRFLQMFRPSLKPLEAGKTNYAIESV